MTIFWVGFGIAIGVELLGRLGQWGAEEESEEREVQPVSISNGTIFKTLVFFCILDWIFKRNK